MALPVRSAFASTVTYSDTDNEKSLDNPSDTYVIQGDGSARKGNNHFTVPSGSSSEGFPIRVTLKDVNINQDGQNPSHAFISVEEGNYVIISLDGNNMIVGGENKQTGDSNGMAAINVDAGSTLKITSVSGDGSTDGKLVAKGGGSKYGGAAIGSNYNRAMGDLVIAGGTIEATGANCAAGIGGGRDSEVSSVTITGGKITAQGGEYGAASARRITSTSRCAAVPSLPLVATGQGLASAVAPASAAAATSAGSTSRAPVPSRPMVAWTPRASAAAKAAV